MSDLCPIAASVNAMNLEEQPLTMGGSLLYLLKTKKFCDVIFTFPNAPARIEAHEFCLKARSPVFEQIFRMRRSGNVQGNEIQISDCTPERFQQFLEFIYLDKFEKDIVGAIDLLQLSRKYKVQPLTMKCEELLKTEIPIVDCVQIFETASRNGCRDLMDRAGHVMVRTFGMLKKLQALTTAEEATLAYLLERDDLSVKEVELFEVVLNWGKNQVGVSADDGLLKNRLKNLISKIRYTNLTPDEFTKVVVPTGFLSAEETVSVYSYFCGDEITRRDLRTKFNPTKRRVEDKKPVTKDVWLCNSSWLPVLPVGFPAFSTQSVSFIADRTQVDGNVQPDYSLRKTLMTAITLKWPHVNLAYRKHHVVNFNISVVEYTGPAEEGNSNIRFQTKLLNFVPSIFNNDKCSVEPPVELVSGRKYSVIIEDHSTSDCISSFRKDPNVYQALSLPIMTREASVDFGNVRLTLNHMHRKTEYHEQKFSCRPQEMDLIRFLEIEVI